MKKIILPTDFSENAFNAIKYAAKLYKEETCTFYLMHAYTPAVYQSEYLLHSPGQIGLGDVYQNQSLQQLEEVKDKIEGLENNPRHTYMIHAAFNLLVDEIIDMTEKEGADVVIMGTQGATGAKEILLGTHAVHVIKKATCPVIAVPANFEYEKPKEILFPTDYEIKYEKPHLQAVLDIADSHISRIEVVHISTGYEPTELQEGNKKELDEMLGSIAHLFHDLPSQDIISGINSFQLKNKVGLLVMVQNKHTFLERLFIEPVIKKIGFHVNLPFMVIPYNNLV